MNAVVLAHGDEAVLHAAAMVATSAVVAVLVYEVLGLKVLTRMWVNLDKLWAVAFVVAGSAGRRFAGSEVGGRPAGEG